MKPFLGGVPSLSEKSATGGWADKCSILAGGGGVEYFYKVAYFVSEISRTQNISLYRTTA